jgi:hypothetical protein
VAAAYLLEASRPSEACRSDRAELDGPRVVAEVRAVTHVLVEAPGEPHAAEEAPRAGPAEAGCSVACPGAIAEADCCAAGFQAAQLEADSAAELPGARLADEQAAPAWSAESPADEKVAAVSSGGFPEDGYSQAVLVAVLAADCSPAVCLGTAEAADPVADWQTADAEPTVPDDHCRQERCEFPEEQDGCQERQAEECCHSVDHRGCCCRGLPDEERSGCCSADRVDCPEHYSAGRDDCRGHCLVDLDEARRRDYLAHSAEPGDSLVHSADLDEELHHDFLDRSVGPDDSQDRSAGRDDCRGHCLVDLDEARRRDYLARSAERGDSLVHLADLEEELRHDFLDHSVGPDDSREHSADLDDWLVRCSAVPDARQGQSDSDHRELRVVTVEPEPPVRHELS